MKLDYWIWYSVDRAMHKVWPRADAKYVWAYRICNKVCDLEDKYWRV